MRSGYRWLGLSRHLPNTLNNLIDHWRLPNASNALGPCPIDLHGWWPCFVTMFYRTHPTVCVNNLLQPYAAQICSQASIPMHFDGIWMLWKPVKLKKPPVKRWFVKNLCWPKGFAQGPRVSNWIFRWPWSLQSWTGSSVPSASPSKSSARQLRQEIIQAVFWWSPNRPNPKTSEMDYCIMMVRIIQDGHDDNPSWCRWGLGPSM